MGEFAAGDPFLEGLPFELLFMIFDYTEERERWRLLRLSRHFRDYLLDNQLLVPPSHLLSRWTPRRDFSHFVILGTQLKRSDELQDWTEEEDSDTSPIFRIF